MTKRLRRFFIGIESAYYFYNKEKFSKWMKKYYLNNKEKILSRKKKYEDENREKVREYKRIYMQDYRKGIRRTGNVKHGNTRYGSGDSKFRLGDLRDRHEEN